MEPTVDTLSEDVSEIHKELEALRAKIQSLHENELFPLRQQASTLDLRFKQVAAAYFIVTLVLAAFGLNAYFREMPKKITEVIETLPGKIDEALKPEVETQVADARKEILEKLKAKMDDVVYASVDFQKVLDEYDKGRMKLVDLDEFVKARLRNEIIVSFYTDVLLKHQEYLAAIELLEELKDKEIFPKECERAEMYCQAGSIQWIMSLSERSPERAERQTRDARRWLENAWKKGQERHITQDIRRPLEWLVLLHLSQGQERLARERAQQYKDSGGDWADLSSHTKKSWFKDLKDRGRPIEQGLEKILASVFSDGKPASRSSGQP